MNQGLFIDIVICKLVYASHALRRLGLTQQLYFPGGGCVGVHAQTCQSCLSEIRLTHRHVAHEHLEQTLFS